MPDYNDDPRNILSAIYTDIRHSSVCAEDVHPKFDNVAFRYYLPGIGMQNEISKDKINVVFNHDFFNLEMLYDVLEQDPTAYLITASKQFRPAPRTMFFPWHLVQTARHNKQLPITVPDSKEYLADALLGINKTHRVDLFSQLIQSSIFSKCLVSMHRNEYYNFLEAGDAYASPEIQALEHTFLRGKSSQPEWSSTDTVELQEEDVNTGFRVMAPVSQVIPRDIYNASWISVVSETAPCGFNNFQWAICNALPNAFFPTEKIAKPLCAGRMFLVSAPVGYLQQLKELGFETFDDVVDESYDAMIDLKDKNNHIRRELERLSKENMSALYKKLLPRLQHNQDLIYSEKLYEPTRNFLESLL